MTRKPNSGPYVVSYIDGHGNHKEKECHTWSDACAFMRERLIANDDDVCVRFV